jgi:hypothetical protein
MPGDGGSDPAAVNLPRWAAPAAVVGGLMLFAILAVLTLTLLQLHDSGGHIESQDKKVGALFRAGRPLAARADHFAAGIRPALRDARGLIQPLVRSGSGTDLAVALDRFPLLDSSLRRLAGEAVPLIDQLDPALLQTTLTAVDDLAAGLQQDDRLLRLVDAASATLAQVADTDLVRRAARSTTRLRKLLEVQRQTRALQRRALGVQRSSLDVQRRSLKHLRKIDRRTGGELPAPAP